MRQLRQKQNDSFKHLLAAMPKILHQKTRENEYSLHDYLANNTLYLSVHGDSHIEGISLLTTLIQSIDALNLTEQRKAMLVRTLTHTIKRRIHHDSLNKIVNQLIKTIRFISFIKPASLEKPANTVLEMAASI